MSRRDDLESRVIACHLPQEHNRKRDPILPGVQAAEIHARRDRATLLIPAIPSGVVPAEGQRLLHKRPHDSAGRVAEHSRKRAGRQTRGCPNRSSKEPVRMRTMSTKTPRNSSPPVSR